MTVFLNANSISELQFHPPGGGRRATEVVSKKRQTFEDYFPRTQKHFPGYLCKETLFKPKLAGVIRGVLERMKGTREDMEKLAAQNTQGGFLNPALKPKAENYPKKLNEFHHAEHVRQINMELKSRIIEGLEREEWYSFEKLEMADRMYEESKLYFEEAALEAVSLGASSILSYASKINPSKIGLNKLNLSKIGFGKVNVSKIIQATPIKGSVGGITFALNSFNVAATQIVRKVAEVGIAQTLDISSKEEKQIPSVGKSPNFKVVDCMKGPDNTDTLIGKVGMAASYLGKIGRFFSPHLNIPATAFNTVLNASLSYNYYTTSERIRAIENENNQKNAEFLSRLKQNICDDFNELQDDEIEALMKHLGINKNEYLSL